MNGCCVYIIIISLLLPSVQSVTFYGPSFSQTLFEELTTSFTLLNSNTSVQIDYESGKFTTNHISTFLANGSSVLHTESTAFIENKTSLVVPMFGFPLVIVYNAPISQFHLTIEVLVKIFVGEITQWNDVDLVTLNPDILLPNASIFVVIGESVMNLFLDGFKLHTNRTLITQAASLHWTNQSVCSAVRITPMSLGFTWMADGLLMKSQFALLQNPHGIFVSPFEGTSQALREFFSLQEHVETMSFSPHDRYGYNTWPLIGILYLLLPQQFKSCNELQLTQQFISFVGYQSENVHILTKLLGWYPASVLMSQTETLGDVPGETYSIHDRLFSLSCGSIDKTTKHLMGASSELWSTLLKLLIPFGTITTKEDFTLSSSDNISFMLNQVSLQTKSSSTDIDAILTWENVIVNYIDNKHLIAIPIFMASMVPIVNMNLPIDMVLSMEIMASIYTGDIIYWNDDRIQVLNRGLLLPFERIVLFAARISSPDGRTAIFSQLLTSVNSNFSWSLVNFSEFTRSRDIANLVQRTPFSIGYALGRHANESIVNVPKMFTTNHAVSFSPDSLSTCWISMNHINCWPMAMKLVFVVRNPTNPIVSCKHQKLAVDFINWVLHLSQNVHTHLILSPNIVMNGADFCNGRSLLITIPDVQKLPSGSKSVVLILSTCGIIWTLLQVSAMLFGRKQRELKSASVLFSLLSVSGIFVMFIVPLLLIEEELNNVTCGTSVWFLSIGFTLCYGSLFAKLFRLYIIFTSRQLVIAKLSNRRLFLIVAFFLIVDIIVLIIYSAVTPAQPYDFKASMLDTNDLVTGYSEVVLTMCAVNLDSPVLQIAIIFKCIIIICGALMSFRIRYSLFFLVFMYVLYGFDRNVDRRFSATSALGWAFFNLFFMTAIAAILVAFFRVKSNLQQALFLPLYAMYWILFITLIALAFDSNVVLVCRSLSEPLKQMRQNKNRSLSETKTTGDKFDTNAQAESGLENEISKSTSSTHLVINKDMFPDYNSLNSELINDIIQEFKNQIMLARQACANRVTTTTTTTSLASEQLPRKSPRISNATLTPRQSTKGQDSLLELSIMDSGPVLEVKTAST